MKTQEQEQGLGQINEAVITESQDTVSNLMGMAGTATSLALLGSTGYFLVSGKKMPRWFLYMVAAKMSIDLIQAAWVMTLVKKSLAPPITPQGREF